MLGSDEGSVTDFTPLEISCLWEVAFGECMAVDGRHRKIWGDNVHMPDLGVSLTDLATGIGESCCCQRTGHGPPGTSIAL